MEVFNNLIQSTGPNGCPKAYKIKCVCWNINNFQSETFKIKLENSDFLEKIQKCDILCLVETHTVKTDILNIPGYGKPFQVNRKKFNKKSFGGIALFFKLELLRGFEICKIESSGENILWVRLKSKADGSFLYIGTVYFSPTRKENLKHSSKFLPELESDILRFSRLGSIILLGDFNAVQVQKIPPIIMIRMMPFVMINVIVPISMV